MSLAPTPPWTAPPAADRVPDALAGGTPAPLRDELEALLGEGRVLHRAIDLVRYASDASPYRLIPQAVVMAHDVQDVVKVLAYGRRTGIPVTFRSGGTSLNGQAQSGGILVDVRRHWAAVRIEDDGARVRVGPGTVVGHVNRALVRHGRRVGPDPASSDFATIGGVIANNSGGMRCGVTADAYSTLRSMTFVLASGTVVDTAAPDADACLARAEPELHAGLAAIRDELRADAELCERIRRKFAIKNTTGYRLCAFLDADEPVHILERLLVGSEGTLGFVAEAVLDTVEHGPHTSTALLFFEGIEAATAPVPQLVAAGATAVELMVNPTLIAAAWSLPGIPEAWKELPPEGASLLVELRSTDPAALDGLEAAAHAALEGCELREPAAFTREREETEVFWRVREGMQGIVGQVRPQGSSVVIEDVCVPPARIAESARDIQALLGEHGFLTGVAGHASAGNLHFLLTPDFSVEADRERYDAFMHALVELIVEKYDGSLKAEHGTGRNMAPYVELEWGAKATQLMWRVKRLADPDGVLNPGTLLSEDADIHLRDLKSTPMIEESGRAHTCIECGFCEPVCPSRHVTTTPRQRIVVRREMARQPAGSPVLAALREQYEYDAVQTCAADGTCALACPLGIDTGRLVKDLRAQAQSARAQRGGVAAARRGAVVERASRAALGAAAVAARATGDRGVQALSEAVRAVAGAERVPRWSAAVPGPAAVRPRPAASQAAAVYLPSCTNRIFGPSRRAGEPLDLPAALVALSARADRPLQVPDDATGLCCGVPWSSKGFKEGHAEMARRVATAILGWTDEGRIPLVIDAASCALGLVSEVPEALGDDPLRERFAQVEVLDPVAWAAQLMPALEVRTRARRVVVHPTCATRHLGQAGALETLAAAVADEVVVPLTATCCGMAGDRGLLHPELTAAATAEEAAQLAGVDADAYVSANRTCEIGLEQATGKPFESIVQLLERATR